MQEDLLRCPKCGSTQISVGKKGFSGKKAVAGAVLFGTIGAAAGTIGQNKVQLTCLNCGEQFKPGEQLKGNKPEIKIQGVSYSGPESRRLYKCNNCGKESSLEKNRPCPKCGKYLTKSELINIDQKLKKSSNLFFIVIAVVIVICLIILL